MTSLYTELREAEAVTSPETQYPRAVGRVAPVDVAEYTLVFDENYAQAFGQFDEVMDGHGSRRDRVMGHYYELTREEGGLDVVRALLIPVRDRRGRPDFQAGHAICYTETADLGLIGHKHLFDRRFDGKAEFEQPYEKVDRGDKRLFSIVVTHLLKR